VALLLSRAAFEEMKRHAEREYPDECCGLLLGLAAEKKALEALRLRNAYPGPKRNRYTLDPLDYARAEEDALAKGLEVVGIYHSHPDHPAYPSSFDLQHAWPWYAYVIISLSRGSFAEARCFYLDEHELKFIEEPLRLITVL
jgi:proteasome lid subunit RPN8/RPN11